MALKQALESIHHALESAGVAHALIGGFALAAYGIQRSTGDVDLLIDETSVEDAIKALEGLAYQLKNQTPEVLHFSGPIPLDLLIARRPLSRGMLARAPLSKVFDIRIVEAEDIIGLKIQAYSNDARRELQDKADIQFLIESLPALDWVRIQSYADLFAQWPAIEAIRNAVEGRRQP